MNYYILILIGHKIFLRYELYFIPINPSNQTFDVLIDFSIFPLVSIDSSQLAQPLQMLAGQFHCFIGYYASNIDCVVVVS